MRHSRNGGDSLEMGDYSHCIFTDLINVSSSVIYLPNLKYFYAIVNSQCILVFPCFVTIHLHTSLVLHGFDWYLSVATANQLRMELGVKPYSSPSFTWSGFRAFAKENRMALWMHSKLLGTFTKSKIHAPTTRTWKHCKKMCSLKKKSLVHNGKIFGRDTAHQRHLPTKISF